MVGKTNIQTSDEPDLVAMPGFRPPLHSSGPYFFSLEAQSGLALPPIPLAAVDVTSVTLTPELWGKILKVQSDVQAQGRQKEDKIDRWIPLSMSPGFIGDCEDFAMEKYTRLLGEGLPVGALRFAIASDLPAQNPGVVRHAVLVVRTDRGDFVLDNIYPKVRHWQDTGYGMIALQAPGYDITQFERIDTSERLSGATADRSLVVERSQQGMQAEEHMRFTHKDAFYPASLGGTGEATCELTRPVTFTTETRMNHKGKGSISIESAIEGVSATGQSIRLVLPAVTGNTEIAEPAVSQTDAKGTVHPFSPAAIVPTGVQAQRIGEALAQLGVDCNEPVQRVQRGTTALLLNGESIRAMGRKNEALLRAEHLLTPSPTPAGAPEQAAMASPTP